MGILIGIIVVIVLWLNSAYHKKLQSFVKNSSTALRALRETNTKYSFIQISCFDMVEAYDNANYYDTISPKDYFSYQLIYKQTAIKKAIADATINLQKMKSYQAEVSSTCRLGNFDTNFNSTQPSYADRLLIKYWLSKGIDKIHSVEQSIFSRSTLNPITEIKVKVDIYLTNIKGRRLAHKSETFKPTDILEIIERLNKKENGIYLDYALWRAICRVERGKVSNKMRFAIYRRDGNRCRKCGSRNNLEVDHIYPISKGGKTTFDNLQTLCHNCNTQKSNIIEPSVVTNRYVQNNSGRICPNCSIPLVKRHGSYGDFWGCPNYPKCKYTAK